MPRYYSPQLRCYVECDVVWNGRDPLSEYQVARWEQYYQSDGVELISQKEIQNARHAIPADMSWRNYPER